jgi:hypothetical protein
VDVVVAGVAVPLGIISSSGSQVVGMLEDMVCVERQD